jgi:hypothetical protein
MPADTAMAVLNNSSLRWKEPAQFNDPFDHQVSYIFPYTEEEMAEELSKEIEGLVFERDATFEEETSVSAIVRMLKDARDTIPKEDMLKTLKEGAAESAQNLKEYQDNINGLLNTVLNNSRVLCVTESNDNVVMWSHYSDEHRGCCLKLHCIDELDNTLLLAKPVQYVTNFPVFPALSENIKQMTGEKLLDMSKLFYDVPYFKHEHWGYENEWRVHVPHKEPSNTNGYNDWREDVRIFGALYLGCRICPKEAAKLMHLVESKYPHMEVYQSRPSIDKFKLEFDRVR